MRIPPHHLGGLPAAQLLQDEERHAALHQPARPGVAQVVPVEVCDACAFEGLAPAFGIDASRYLWRLETDRTAFVEL